MLFKRGSLSYALNICSVGALLILVLAAGVAFFGMTFGKGLNHNPTFQVGVIASLVALVSLLALPLLWGLSNKLDCSIKISVQNAAEAQFAPLAKAFVPFRKTLLKLIKKDPPYLCGDLAGLNILAECDGDNDPHITLLWKEDKILSFCVTETDVYFDDVDGLIDDTIRGMAVDTTRVAEIAAKSWPDLMNDVREDVRRMGESKKPKTAKVAPQNQPAPQVALSTLESPPEAVAPAPQVAGPLAAHLRPVLMLLADLEQGVPDAARGTLDSFRTTCACLETASKNMPTGAPALAVFEDSVLPRLQSLLADATPFLKGTAPHGAALTPLLASLEAWAAYSAKAAEDLHQNELHALVARANTRLMVAETVDPVSTGPVPARA